MNIHELLNKKLNDDSVAKMSGISKEDFKNFCNACITRMSNMLESYRKLTDLELNKFATKIINKAKDPKNVYSVMYVKLDSIIKQKDKQIAFDSYAIAASLYQDILNNLLRSLDELFSAKEINIYNTQVSHTLALSIATQSDIFIKRFSTLFNGVIYEVVETNGIRELPQPSVKRCKELESSLVEFGQHTRHLLLNGSKGMLALINYYKKSKDNFNIVNSQTKALDPRFINIDGIGPKGFFGEGALYLFQRFIMWTKTMRNLAHHERYRQAVAEREWIESHVNLLKLNLMDADPDSPEYRKQVKIIEAYNQILEKLNAQIESYENED